MVKLTGRKWIAVVVLVVGLAVGLLWAFGGGMKSGVKPMDSDAAFVSDGHAAVFGRASWGAGSGDVDVRIDVERPIPGFRGGVFSGASLIPLPTATTGMAWETERVGDDVLVSGQGLWRERKVEVSWRFVSGDPQSRVRVVLRDVPVSELLASDIAGRVEIGRPVERFMDKKLRVFGGDAAKSDGEYVAWAQWGDGRGGGLTLSRVVADGVSVESSSEQATGLIVAFWRRDLLDSAVLGCDVMAEKTVDLVVELDWTVGKSLPVAAAVLPHGYRAALVPVFGDLQSSGSLEMKQGAAQGAEDWLGRARTLIYGHSSDDDPRYGNGGLLGAHFGGSVVVPAAWWDDAGVKSLATELVGTRVELVSDGKTRYLVGNDVCEHAFQAVEGGASVLIVPGPDGEEIRPLTGRIGHARGLPQVMGVVALDGKRNSLVEGVFSQDSLERLLAEEDVLAISTPLVATRNPLIGLWHEAILSAERGGAWTLQSDVSRAFARGELLRETERLLISSVSGLEDYWRHRAQVDIWQGPNGEVVVYNAGAMPVEGFTFVVAEMVKPVGVDGASVRGLGIAHHDGLSYVSLDLEAGERQEVYLNGLGDERVVGSPLSGVRWLVDGE